MKKSNLMIIITCIILLMTVLFIPGMRVKKNNYRLAKMNYYSYLDTISYVFVEYDESQKNLNDVQKDLEYIKNILLDIEKEFSISQTINMKNEHIDKSTVMIINELSGQVDENNIPMKTKVSSNFIKLLNISQKVSLMTSGGYDVSIGPLTTLWDISNRSEYCSDELINEYIPNLCCIPSDVQIEKAKSLVNYQNIIIDDLNNTVYLKEKGMKLDFGAIAKGFAADVILDYLKSLGYEFILINLGGNSLIMGEPVTQDNGVKTEIQNPFANNTVLEFVITDQSIVTSGIYERYIVYNHQKYSHLINPLTGYPYDNNIESITIITPSSAIADAMSTGIYTLGLEKGLAKVNELENTYAIFIMHDKKIYLSNNFSAMLTNEAKSEFMIIK